MKKRLVYFVFATIFIACNNSNESSKEEQNVVEPEETSIDPAQQQLRTAFPDIFRTFSQQDSTFDVNKFEDSGYDSLKTPALSETRQLKPYYPFFIYNADSAYAIDLYSYNVLLVNKNGKMTPQEAGPDTEVGLVDVKNKTRQRVYFGGSSSAVLDARWISNNEFFLLTGEFIGSVEFQPTILKYNLTERTITHFAYPDTLNLGAMEYRARKLNNL